MAVNSVAAVNYSDMFYRYILRSAEYILACVQEETSRFSIDNQELGMHTLNFTLKLAEGWPVTRNLLLAMAPKMEQAGYRDEWMVYLESGIEQSQKVSRAGMLVGDVEAEAELRFQLGVLYKHQAKHDEARCQLEASVRHFEQLGNSHHQARALISLANVVRRQRRLNEAKQLVKAAQELLLGEEKAEQAHGYLVLGAIALDQHKWPDAYDFFSKSLALWEERNDQRMIAWGLTNLGVVLWQMGKYEDAIAYYKRAINQFEIVQDPLHQAIASMNLGNVYIEFDRFQLALELYLLAQPIFHKTQDKFHLAMLHNNKGMAYQKLQQLDKAAQTYVISIELWQQIGHIGSLVNVMDNLGLLYLEQQLYDKAISTFQDALNQLAQIKGKPGYDDLFDMVTAHLCDANEQQRP